MEKSDLEDQCELIQDDLICVLDGIDERILDNVCQVIVDRFAVLKEKNNHEPINR